MIREDDHSIDGKGIFFGDVPKRLAQEVTGHGVAEHWASVGGDDGEKVGCPRDKSSTVVHKRGEGVSDYASGSFDLRATCGCLPSAAVAIATTEAWRVLWNPDRAKLQFLLGRCCMPLDEYKRALGATLGGTIFTVHLSSWYVETMQHELFGADVPTCREFLADVDRRSPGWRFFSVSFPRPGKSGNFPPQVPDFQRFRFEGGGDVQPLAAASTLSTPLATARILFAMRGPNTQGQQREEQDGNQDFDKREARSRATCLFLICRHTFIMSSLWLLSARWSAAAPPRHNPQ